MPLIGYHTSSAGGYFNAAIKANELKLDTFQLFLGSPRTWSYRDLKDNEVEKFKSRCEEFGFNIKTVHMNYLPNPSTPLSDTDRRKKVMKAFETEIKRCDLLDINYLVFHIGSHLGNGFQVAKESIVKTLEQSLELNPNVMLLLETSAGSSNAVGASFEEIGKILDDINDTSKIGVCFDTCHVYAAGYDISHEDGIRNTFEEFDKYIGLDKMKVIHANDSKGKLGEGKDRHEHIGKGNIGEKGFKALLAQPKVKDLPVILETPSKGIKQDIEKLKELSPDH